MSIDLMSAVWDRGPESTTNRFVLLALANYADQEGYCWPSYDSIARRCAIHRTTAIRAVKELEADGWLRRAARMKDDGREQTSNGYYLNMRRLMVVAEDNRGSSVALPPSSRVLPLPSSTALPPSSTALPGVVAERYPNLHSEPSINRHSGSAIEVDDDDGEAQAIAAGQRILKNWQMLTGRTAPRDNDEWARDWFAPVNQLWARLGKDEDATFEAMRAQRQEMVNSGKTPFRPSAVVPYALAALDKSETAAPVYDKNYFAEA